MSIKRRVTYVARFCIRFKRRKYRQKLARMRSPKVHEILAAVCGIALAYYWFIGARNDAWKEIYKNNLGMIENENQLSEEQRTLNSHDERFCLAETSTTKVGKIYTPFLTFGRLGNHLFQYASLYGISRCTRRMLVILPNFKVLEGFQNITAGIEEAIPPNLPRYMDEKFGSHSMTVYRGPDEGDVQINGLMLSWRYFDGYEEDIRQQYKFKDVYVKQAQTILQQYTREYLENIGFKEATLTYVGVHVRRGDIADPSVINQTGWNVAPATYIRHAMDYYRGKYPDVLFVMTTNGHPWCEQHFADEIDNKEVYLVPPGRSDFDDLSILAACNHTVMTVGTYGWWAAWLAGGDVTYYRHWPRLGTGVYNNFNLNDFFPKHWTALE